MGWYTVVSSGGGLVSAYPTDWPRGPWRSHAEGEDALERWARRREIEYLLGTIKSAHNLRIVGPFRTRDIARRVDISNYTNYLEPV